MALFASQSDHCYSRVLDKLISTLNVKADWESRNHKDSSNWKLNLIYSLIIVNIKGVPQIDLCALRLNNQLPKYMSWHPDQGSCAVVFL